MGRHRTPALYRPVRILVLGLVILASLSGLLAAAVGEAMWRGHDEWGAVFAVLFVLDVVIYWWVTCSLTQFLSTDPVDRSGRHRVRSSDERHDHHPGEPRHP